MNNLWSGIAISMLLLLKQGGMMPGPGTPHSAAAAVVTPVGTPACTGIGSSVSSVSISYNPAATGDALVVFVGSTNNDTGTWTVRSITDNAGTPSSYTASLAYQNGSSRGVANLGGTTSLNGGVTTVTANLSATVSNPFICVSEYSGVSSFGNTITSTNSQSGSYTIGPITLQHTNEYAVGAWERTNAGPPGTPPTATAGTVRASGGDLSGNLGWGFIQDITGAAGAVSMTGTITSNHSYQSIAVELMHS